MRSGHRVVGGGGARLLAALLLLGLLCGVVAAVAIGAEKGTVQPISGSALYAVDPTPMTVAECGRCHRSHFMVIKESGGKHQIDCQECHEVFHAYNPRRDNYATIMPQCANCHTLPHGAKFAECQTCHDNPHAPRLLPVVQQLAKHCSDCHGGPTEQLAKAPSAHTKQPCAACHSNQHGRIPACAECHQPHYTGQAADTCRACHPAHQPLQIAFTPQTDPKNCVDCHTQASTAWTNTRSKHGKVNCTVCHTRHGQIPACTDCHKSPHDPKMLARFKVCLDCHFDPHNPPTK